MKIAQDPAFELKDVIEAFVLHEHRRLFTANAAGAEHGNFLIFFAFELITDELWELAERRVARVNGTGKGPYFGFERVAGVDDDRVWIADQIVPSLCI